MSASPQGLERAARLSLASGQIVQEVGYDTDCDADLREAVVEIIGADFVDLDFEEVVDAALLWFREDDGDLTDALVDAITPLADQGVVWLLTPKPGRDGHIEPEDITDAAQTAGLRQTSTISASDNWQGTRLVAPRAKR
ncbi:MAG: DUF3052 domain-containing protein [Candidatus Nanopelagicales bacterium]|nr:DUF3052 domain-containing protein [Actinomycetes bacterium]MCH9737499.1 DUF3052 domain-containing protein [Actinomycetes bacterium]